MPRRRTIKRGSFGSHFDDLLEHFSHDTAEESAPPPAAEERPTKRVPKVSVHQALFERIEH